MKFLCKNATFSKFGKSNIFTIKILINYKAFYKEKLYIKDGADYIVYTIQPQTNYTATNRVYSHKLQYIVYIKDGAD